LQNVQKQSEYAETIDIYFCGVAYRETINKK
jgi:hypothetical protein